MPVPQAATTDRPSRVHEGSPWQARSAADTCRGAPPAVGTTNTRIGAAGRLRYSRIEGGAQDGPPVAAGTLAVKARVSPSADQAKANGSAVPAAATVSPAESNLRM